MWLKLSWSLESSEHFPFDKLFKLKLDNSLLGFCLLFQIHPPSPPFSRRCLGMKWSLHIPRTQGKWKMICSLLPSRSSLASLSAWWPWLLCPACSEESGNLQILMDAVLYPLLMTTDLSSVFCHHALYIHGLSVHPQVSSTPLGSSTIALDIGANLEIKPTVEEFSC